MRLILALLLLSSCINLKPMSRCKTEHYVRRHNGMKIYTTRQTCYYIINDTIK